MNAVTTENEKTDPEYAPVRVTDSDRVDQNVFPPRLCYDLRQRVPACIVHPVGHDQQRLFIIATAFDHGQTRHDCVEECGIGFGA